MLAFKRQGIPTFDYGNSIRQMAKEEGVADAFDFPTSCPPTSGRCSAGGVGHRWAALTATRKTSTRRTPRSRNRFRAPAAG